MTLLLHRVSVGHQLINSFWLRCCNDISKGPPFYHWLSTHHATGPFTRVPGSQCYWERGDCSLVQRPNNPTYRYHWSYASLVIWANSPTLKTIGPAYHWSYYPIVQQPSGPTYQSEYAARFIGLTAHWSYDTLLRHSIDPTDWSPGDSWPHCSYNPLVLRLNSPTTPHYNDVTMGEMASQITSLTIVYSTVYSGTDQRKHQSSASLAFVRGIHRWPVNTP